LVEVDVAVDLTVAFVLGAGRGVRMERAMNKMYLELAGVPMIVRSTSPFVEHPGVDETYVVAAPQEVDRCAEVLASRGCDVDGVITGGASRHASEAAAVAFLGARIEAGEVGIVVIHDGARPLFRPESLAPLLDAARSTGGAILALPLNDELVSVEGSEVTGRRIPGGLWRAQTPQAFEAAGISRAFQAAASRGFEGTDTASTAEHFGIPVAIVPGDPRNIKVTLPEDIAVAESLLKGSQS